MTPELLALKERIIYLERICNELVYLAKCKGWKFDHITRDGLEVNTNDHLK